MLPVLPNHFFRGWEMAIERFPLMHALREFIELTTLLHFLLGRDVFLEECEYLPAMER